MNQPLFFRKSLFYEDIDYTPGTPSPDPVVVDNVTAGTWTGSAQPLTVAATGAENGDGVYWVIVPAADSAPSASEVRAGQANGGGSPTESGNDVWPGPFSDTLVSGIPNGSYKIYVVIDNGALSNVGASDAFTVDTTPADLGTPTVTGGTAVIDWAFTADEDSDAVTGWRVSYWPDGTEPSDAEIESGTGSTATTTGTASASVEESGQFTSVAAGVHQPTIFYKDTFGNKTYLTLADVTVTAAAAGPQVNGTPVSAYESTSATSTGGSGVSFTAAAGSNRLITAIVDYGQLTPAATTATPSMGAQAFTLAGSLGSTTGGIAKVQMFYIKEADIPAGANTISITFDQNVAYPHVTIVEWTGVDQTTPVVAASPDATLSFQSDTTLAYSITTSAANSVVLTSVHLFNTSAVQTFTPSTDTGGSVTEITQHSLGAGYGQSVAFYESVASSSTSVGHDASWTPNTARWGRRSMEIKAA
jgi:hypothetical protein